MNLVVSQSNQVSSTNTSTSSRRRVIASPKLSTPYPYLLARRSDINPTNSESTPRQLPMLSTINSTATYFPSTFQSNMPPLLYPLPAEDSPTTTNSAAHYQSTVPALPYQQQDTSTAQVSTHLSIDPQLPSLFSNSSIFNSTPNQFNPPLTDAVSLYTRLWLSSINRPTAYNTETGPSYTVPPFPFFRAIRPAPVPQPTTPLLAPKPMHQIDWSSFKHFSRHIQTSAGQRVQISSTNVAVFPHTYFSTNPAFELAPQQHFTAVICDVPAALHKPGMCVLLRDPRSLENMNLCVKITNKSKSLNISVPPQCDLSSFIDNPLMRLVMGHIKTNLVPV